MSVRGLMVRLTLTLLIVGGDGTFGGMDSDPP